MTDRDRMTLQQKAEGLGFAQRVNTRRQLERLIAARVERESRPQSEVWRRMGGDLNEAERRLAVEERE